MMNKRESSTIVRQLQVVFAISITILVASSLASYYSSKKLIEASQWVNHTNDVLISAESLISTAKDAETAQRGYIITNDSVFLQPYLHAYDRASAIYEHLAQTTMDNPAQQKRLQRVKVIMDERFRKMDQTLATAALTSSLLSRTQAYIGDKGDMLRGKEIMDELRSLIEEVKTQERSLLQKRLVQQNLYRIYTPPTVVIASLVSVLITIMAYYRIKRDMADRMQKQKEDEETYIETRRRIGKLEDLTRQIASGDYSIRSKESVSDDLGRIGAALNAMAASLERNFNELEEQNWQQKGTVIVGDAIRSERDVARLCNRLVDAMARYAGAQVGTLYTDNVNEQYKLSGMYAADNAPQVIRARQGLAGQAIASKELIATEALPAEFVKVSSSLGQIAPVYAVIVPFVHYGKVVGVIELGFVQKPAERTLQFLQANAEKVAIGLNTARNFEQLQELLEETQAQTEELQAQHPSWRT
jgi:CHASE3 domain sensor protein